MVDAALGNLLDALFGDELPERLDVDRRLTKQQLLELFDSLEGNSDSFVADLEAFLGRSQFYL